MTVDTLEKKRSGRPVDLIGHHPASPLEVVMGPIEQPAPEEEIVWLDDPAKYPYLREMEIFVTGLDNYATRPRRTPGKLIGYSTARAGQRFKMQPGLGKARLGYLKRVWYLLKDDPYPGAEHAAHGPLNSVNPASIRAGKPSNKGAVEDDG